MAHFQSALAIGGTGMLAATTRWLAAHSGETLVVARRAGAFVGTPRIAALDADWGGPSFQQDLLGRLRRSRQVDAALIWLHEPRSILPWLLPELASARVVLVLGSLDGRPEIPEAGSGIATVRLGGVDTAIGRRWLSHDEICAGAIASLEDGRSRIVGVLGGPAD